MCRILVYFWNRCPLCIYLLKSCGTYCNGVFWGDYLVVFDNVVISTQSHRHTHTNIHTQLCDLLSTITATGFLWAPPCPIPPLASFRWFPLYQFDTHQEHIHHWDLHMQILSIFLPLILRPLQQDCQMVNQADLCTTLYPVSTYRVFPISPRNISWLIYSKKQCQSSTMITSPPNWCCLKPHINLRGSSRL